MDCPVGASAVATPPSVTGDWWSCLHMDSVDELSLSVLLAMWMALEGEPQVNEQGG